MAATEQTPPRNGGEDIQLPTGWPMIPILIVDHSQDPPAGQRITSGAEWHSNTKSVPSRSPSRITETERRPASNGSAGASTKQTPSPLPTRSVTPSSPMYEDWSLRDKAFEVGPISPQWTVESEGPLSPQWEKQQRKASSSSESNLKEPKKTVYHIYQNKSRRHYVATTKPRPKKKMKCCFKGDGGCGLFRRSTKISKKELAEAIEKGLMSATSNTNGTLPEEQWDSGDFPPEYAGGEEKEEEEGYFWHQPFGLKKRKLKKVRTFRRGVSKKNSTVLAEVPDVMFWKRWDIMWRDEEDENARKLQHAATSWFIPAEQNDSNNDSKEKTKRKKKKAAPPVDPSKMTRLIWVSPFSRQVRQHTFTHGPITFHWKGTSTLRGEGPFKAWCRYNHLKLVAEIPLDSPVAGSAPRSTTSSTASAGSQSKGKAASPPLPLPTHHELLLAHYASNATPTKPGTLTLHDDAIDVVWRAFIAGADATTPLDGLAAPLGDKQRGDVFSYERRAVVASEFGCPAVPGSAVKDSRFWDAIVATALCMIIGEWKKRETVRQVIQAIAGGAGSA